ncbi:hypothetical protein CONPUDRAFT_139152 [Coniophora puteana RWD-64-598 SS2]|uniref:Uncharacterized protein n=1 Tax=Coniophora puteana (strain RWD-64-598) TaxID=741705 RepID=A0A5M3ME47_CONPW|nr:uncharacterized protein CONPUDRAFT_139152 [Coniophora puteana RWD-64-598 SS2]EIW77074.1 hypothetical protein CONPUDRAFT_139152 [Coniophora puteana RWD-64-598 SS2]
MSSRILPKFWGFAISESFLLRRAAAAGRIPRGGTSRKQNIVNAIEGTLRNLEVHVRPPAQSMPILVLHHDGNRRRRLWCVALATSQPSEDLPLPSEPPEERYYEDLAKELKGVVPQWYRMHEDY